MEHGGSGRRVTVIVLGVLKIDLHLESRLSAAE